MKISEADILIAPGLGNSGPGHWQRRWGARMANARFIDQDDWDHPVLGDWIGRIHQEIMLATRPVVLMSQPCRQTSRRPTNSASSRNRWTCRSSLI